MSKSSMYIVNNKYDVAYIEEFKNSWLFSPIIWSVLCSKYLDNKYDQYGYPRCIIGLDGVKVWNELNEKMNISNNIIDKICWELSNQAAFFVKNKNDVAKAIRRFCTENNTYKHKNDDEYPILDKHYDHILERFEEVATIIENISDNNFCFIHKNTSVDDSVENLFIEWNEDIEEEEDTSLDETNIIFQFTDIKNGVIKYILSNEYEYNRN